MRRVLFGIVLIPIALIFLINLKTKYPLKEETFQSPQGEKRDDHLQRISGTVMPGETLASIFDRYNLDRTELHAILRCTKGVYDLSRLSVGNVYLFMVDEQDRIQSMHYGIDSTSFLEVRRSPEGFKAEKIEIEYTKKIGSLFILIKDNLIQSMPNTHREYLRLALKLSDIYAWDIDFFSDIRDGDYVKMIVEELWAGGVFIGYGDILAAEFLNNGTIYRAYRFEYEGSVDYFDQNGKSLRKALLRSPLRFKYISSHFSKRRFHPILRIYRPHLGVDYAAPVGTPVSAAGDGVVVFAGYKGQYGKMVRIRHGGALETYYGHLSRIHKRIKRGVKVSQGEIIGYVGSTGLSTGPHLDYRIKLNGRFVNPLKVQLPRGKAIPASMRPEFSQLVRRMDTRLALLRQPFVAYSAKEGIHGG